MSPKKVTPKAVPRRETPIGSVVHTTEAGASAERAEEELKAEDPGRERAVATLTGGASGGVGRDQ